MTSKLELGGPCALHPGALTREDLAGMSGSVEDVGRLVEGREGAAVPLAALVQRIGVTPEARWVHVASEDGDFTANIELEEALRDGLVLFELHGEPLPRRFGGPFRLLFADSSDCSVNVKFLARVELVAEPGSHTARCAD